MVLASLRRLTAELHTRVENSVDLPRRTGHISAYQHLLARLFGLYSPIEARLDQMTGLKALELDWPARRKVPLLRADLVALGCSTTDISPCPFTPPLPDLPEALGCLYVLEGSTLGGQVIRRQVERSLHLGPETGCRFFAGYGADVGSMWKSFCAVLERTVTEPSDVARAAGAAVQTFEAFEAWVALPPTLGRRRGA